MKTCTHCNLPYPDSAQFCSRCGSALNPAPPAPGGGAAPTPPPPGQTLPLHSQLHGGQYLILNKLAAGGMGAVYLAQDTQLFNRFCVVKEMLPYYATPAEQTEAEAKFEREARLLATLRHPGVPQVYDYFIEQGRYYLVMEFVEGDNLEQKSVRAGGALPWREVADYAAQVASVLVYIGQQKPPVIHRDIKPANIILDRNTGQVKLVDFGIAREGVSAGGPAQSSALGTPGYSPPEQYAHNAAPASDVFALGATMHHLLTGRDPRQATALFKYDPLPQIAPGIPPDLATLVHRMLELDPAARPTAEQVRDELKQIGQPASAPATPFAFRSGAIANTAEELALACDRNWSDGVYHLYEGHFEVWLQSLNRYDLAQRAQTIRLRGGDPNAGLEEFIRAVYPTMALPSLRVAPPHLMLGIVEKGARLTATVEVENVGRGYLYGEARPLVPWVRVAAPPLGLWHGDRMTLTLELDTSALAEGNISQPVLLLATNGGQTAVSVQLLITWQPRLAVDPPRLNLGEVLEEQLGQGLSGQFVIRNDGGGALDGWLRSSVPWLYPSVHQFRLWSGQSLAVSLTADTRQLALARSTTADIYLSSVTGTSVTLPVHISVVRRVYQQRALRWAWYGLWLLLAVLCGSLTALWSALVLLGTGWDPLAVTVGLLAVTLLGGLALRLARSQVALLDEIEDYYAQGRLAQAIPPGQRDGRSVAATAGWLALAGLLVGASYYRFQQAVWAIPAGVLAGALLGALLAADGPANTGARRPRQLGWVRPLLAALLLAFLGLLVDLRGGAPAWWQMGWWATAGLILGVGHTVALPLRLRGLLAHVRGGLLGALLAYAGWLMGVTIAYQAALPIWQFYIFFPGIDVIAVFKHALVMGLTIGGLILGLWADHTGGVNRRQQAISLVWALGPGLLVAIPSLIVGTMIFGLFGLFGLSDWQGWGVMTTVLTVVAVAAWLAVRPPARFTAALAPARTPVQQALASLGQSLPAIVTDPWRWTRQRLTLRPPTGWPGLLTGASVIALVSALVLLTPLATQITLSVGLLCGCLTTVLLVIAGVIAFLWWYITSRS